ncbi:MAG: phage integrase SAM-like domain-containing protein [Agriterribacter sp.]
MPTEYGMVEELETVLSDKLRKAEDMINYAIRHKKGCPLKFLRINFPLSDKWQIEQMTVNKNTQDVYFNIDCYIQEREAEVKQCTLNVIRTMKIHLMKFEEYRNKPITFDSFDFEFYFEFIRYLTHEYPQMRKKQVIKGLKVNTLGKTIKWLKTFLKNRMAKKIIPFMDLSNYKVVEEEVDAIYLNWKEISAIYKLDLKNDEKLEIVRDEFILGCLTGFRFSDYSTIQPDEIRDGMLFIRQSKTADRVVVPLRPETKAILEKYNMQMPYISNQEFNFYIKEVAQKAGLTGQIKFSHKRGNKIEEEVRPKYAWVMSHTCRRSFCTNEFLDGTPVTLIMAISGHKTEKAFRKYIKADALQKAEMIKKIWEGRPSII